MKKLLYLCTIILVVACSSDDSVTPSNNDGTDLNVTGTVSEQTPTEAKETIYGKWNFISNSRLAASDCDFNSIEFTDDVYIMQVTVDGETQTLSGDYDINVRFNKNDRYSENALYDQNLIFRDPANGLIKEIPISAVTYTSLSRTFSKIKHKNFIFSNGVDLVHEFFNFERKIRSDFLSKSVQKIGRYPLVNKMFTKIADRGILF